MPSIKEAKERLGELFIVGFGGGFGTGVGAVGPGSLDLSPETAQFFKDARIGGTILFAHNYDSPAQLAELTNQIQECRTGELPLWVGVDQEGGKVQRFKKPFTRIPDAQSIGAANSPKLAYEISEMIAKELKAVGVNLNFSPVADIATNPKNPVIGPRAYGSDEDSVSRIVSAMVRGHLTVGVQPCIKHFPGHGDTSTDSHYALPKIDTPIEILREREFRPFSKAFKSRCSMVMTAHILHPGLDREFPATLSQKVLQEILRKELRYAKVIVSDDMEMKAITDHFGPEDAPRLAIQAGCDQLIYRSEIAARAAYFALIQALESKKLSADRVLESANRVRQLKKEALLPYEPVKVHEVGRKIGIPQHLELLQRLDAPKFRG